MTGKTLVITKEGHRARTEYIREEDAKTYGEPYAPLTDEEFEKRWKRMRFRNRGANDEYPISDDEIRYGTSNTRGGIENLKKWLDERGFTYRDDGFIEEYDYI